MWKRVWDSRIKDLPYRRALAQRRDARKLYLAVPDQTFFQIAIIEETIRDYQINLIVVNSANREIIQWIE